MVVEIKNAIELANDKGNLRTYQEGKENNQNFNWGKKTMLSFRLICIDDCK